MTNVNALFAAFREYCKKVEGQRRRDDLLLVLVSLEVSLDDQGEWQYSVNYQWESQIQGTPDEKLIAAVKADNPFPITRADYSDRVGEMLADFRAGRIRDFD